MSELVLGQPWKAVPDGKIYPEDYKPGDKVTGSLVQIAAELGLDKPTADAPNSGEAWTPPPENTGLGTLPPETPAAPAVTGAEVVPYETRHVGAGKYGVFLGAERLTTEPLTKPEADAQRDALEAAAEAAKAVSAVPASDGATNDATGASEPGSAA